MNGAGSTEEILPIFSSMPQVLFIIFSFFSRSNLPLRKKGIINGHDTPDSARSS